MNFFLNFKIAACLVILILLMAFRSEENESIELKNFDANKSVYLLPASSDSSVVCSVFFFGTVSNMKNKRLRDVRVEIKGKDRIGYTDKKGKYQFKFEQLKGDSVKVLFSKNGYKDKVVIFPWIEPSVTICGFDQGDGACKPEIPRIDNAYEFLLDVELEKID